PTAPTLPDTGVPVLILDTTLDTTEVSDRGTEAAPGYCHQDSLGSVQQRSPQLPRRDVERRRMTPRPHIG
ncbi:hypothetical protein, partial [Mycobacterium marinum]|uniref:hypothetical protein n=1 Tax=Mycobacterium marinum TaxID=1781 RepID=UPI0021C3EB5F